MINDKKLETLKTLTKKIAVLVAQEKVLTEEIVKDFNHTVDGQRTYEHNLYKVTTKTPFIYSINKAGYDLIEESLPQEFNPITKVTKTTIAYNIDKEKCDLILHEAPDTFREALNEIIEKKPGKANVNISWNK